jgi:NTP pyrophosphatase (non-canonical NTP hydrolase)
MTNEEYQEATNKFAVYPKKVSLEYLTLAIASEAGEVAGVRSKLLRGDFKDFSDYLSRFKKELGDVLWNASQICNTMGWTLGDVMQDNIDKLQERMATNTIKGSGESVGERVANGV